MKNPNYTWAEFVLSGANAFNSAKASRALAIGMYQHNVVAKVKTRKYSDTPYFVHPIRVALMTAAHPLAVPHWVFAAVLHDTIEDTVPLLEDKEALKVRIATEVDVETLDMVLELTNVKRTGMNRRQNKELDWERLSKVSIGAKIVKMFDRIDNLREMTDASDDFKKLYVYESRQLVKFIGDADDRLANQLKDTASILEATVK